VQFQVDGVNFGSPVSLVDGIAGFSTAGLTAGAHTITAVYSGDGNFLGHAGNLAHTVHGGVQPTIASLTTAVTNLVTSGALNQGVGLVLVATLNLAQRLISHGHTTAAILVLEAFLCMIDGLATCGLLSQQDAVPLMSATGLLIRELRG
jgi:hypothetical protein